MMFSFSVILLVAFERRSKQMAKEKCSCDNFDAGKKKKKIFEQNNTRNRFSDDDDVCYSFSVNHLNRAFLTIAPIESVKQVYFSFFFPSEFMIYDVTYTLYIVQMCMFRRSTKATAGRFLSFFFFYLCFGL